ncbi:class I SAM-dependent methyltransferase [Mangrovimonas cancribranchiae]|uniref:Methyltransferase domain-containing protein n=1 Tax=Mangrovimonas cancribranchiae TaxID=3080055 RepID=A0AAU6P8R7_9FLAO
MNLIKLIKSPKPYIINLKKVFYRHYWRILKKGTAVNCPVCNWQGKNFLQGCCPKCRSLARTRLIPYSINYFKLSGEQLNVLHVAPNRNEYLSAKRALGGVKTYDKLDIRQVAHVNLVQDLTRLTLADALYDRAIIWHVFEHIVEDTKAISEVYRVLKPGGKLLMSVPIYPANNPKTYEDPSIPYKDYEKVHGHDDHCRSCGLDYFKRFEAAGFTTETLQVKDVSESERTYYGLSSNHVVWCFTK